MVWSLILEILIKFWYLPVIFVLTLYILHLSNRVDDLKGTIKENEVKCELAQSQVREQLLEQAIKALQEANEKERRISEVAEEHVKDISERHTKTEIIIKEQLQPIINNLGDGCFTSEWVHWQNKAITTYTDSNSKD